MKTNMVKIAFKIELETYNVVGVYLKSTSTSVWFFKTNTFLQF